MREPAPPAPKPSDPAPKPSDPSGARPSPSEHDRLDHMLDAALTLTFPGSDPVAITTSANRPSLRVAAGERAALPDDCAPYRRTAEFTENTVPAGLLRAHRTASGVWALIHVTAGKLIYRVSGPAGSERVIGPEDRPGVIEPERLHEVEPLGPVRFYVEFHRRAARPPVA